ncbi:MAG: hypothetical protein K9M94_01275, partial [Spirochaetia bacterium]|nr:hypothetical protein [Spirochaetia bacterium]
TGIGGAFAAGMIGSGISMMAAGYTLYNMEFPTPQSRENTEQDPSIRGSRNRANRGGPVPLILGRHLITPDHGALPFTSVDGQSQFLHQLFVIGYNDLVVETDTMKIGDTPVDQYHDVSPVEVITDGSLSAYYGEICKETNVGREIKNQLSGGGSGAIVQTTPSGTRRIGVDIAFPRGLVKYNEENDKKNRSVDVRAYYKPHGAADTEYQLLGYWDGSSTVVTASQVTTLRRSLEKSLDNADETGADWHPDRQYDVKLERVTADTTDSRYIDSVYWGSLRAFIPDPPISDDMRPELCIVGLKVKASDQFQGTVDQFNCVAQTRILNYRGPTAGSGPSAWSLELTSNPASMYLYVLTSHINSRPVSYDRIDWPTLESWHQWCDEHGYEVNAVISREQPRDKLLQAICTAGRAHPGRIDGKYTVILDAERATPIQHFTPRNSWGFSGQKEFPEKPHALKVSFINADMGWQSDERIVYDEGYNAYGSGGLTPASRFQKVDGWGITSPEQAWKTGRYMLAVTRLRPEIFSINVDIEHLVCTRGDRVLVSHDVPLYGIASGRITTLTADGSGYITHLGVDELLSMEDGKTYGLTIRRSDGTFLTAQLVTAAGDWYEVGLSSPVAPAESPSTGDLFSYGEWGRETVDMIITGIEPAEEMSAKLTMVEYAPGIFGIDDPSYEIPLYDPKITKPGDKYEPPKIIDIYNPAADIKDISDKATATAAASVSYSDLEIGYENPVSGSTIIPENVAQFLAQAYGTAAILLVWDRQLNLTNCAGYELSVSETGNPSDDWYPPRFDGVHWREDTPGVYFVPFGIERFIHNDIPPVGSLEGEEEYAEDPQPRHLYYRIRQVTKQGGRSPGWTYSDAPMSLLPSRVIAKDTIAANHIKAGVIEALVGQFENLALSDYTGLEGISDDRQRRLSINSEMIKFFEQLLGSMEEVARITAYKDTRQVEFTRSIRVGEFLPSAAIAYYDCNDGVAIGEREFGEQTTMDADPADWQQYDRHGMTVQHNIIIGKW